MQRPTLKSCLELKDSFIRFWERIEGQKWDSKSTERWTESTNLDTEVSQRLSHPWMTIYEMELDPLLTCSRCGNQSSCGFHKTGMEAVAFCGIHSFGWASPFVLSGRGCPYPFIDLRYHDRGRPSGPPASQNIRGSRYVGGRNVGSTDLETG